MKNGRDHAGLPSIPAQASGYFVSGLAKLQHGLLAFLLALSLLAGSAAGVFAETAATPVSTAVADHEATQLTAAVDWLLGQQTESGAFPGMSGDPDPGTTVDALLALVSAPDPDAEAIAAAIGYLNENAADYIDAGAGQAAKIVLGFVAAGADPTAVDGKNPVEAITAGINPETNICGFGVFDHAYCLLAEFAVNGSVPQEWIDGVLAVQAPNGGWGFTSVPDDASVDSNTTALVVQSLIAIGAAPDDAAITQAIAYLATTRVATGGFAYSAIPFDSGATNDEGTPIPAELVADANSTAVVIQALIAADVDLTAPEWGDPVAALNLFQNESGGFRYMDSMPDDNLFATVQAIPAMAGMPLGAIIEN